MRSKFEVNATMVANEFIDRYMAVANGEYVKVYLYLLRHDGREITVGEIADALNHTESDVKRAIAYWVRLGVLEDADAQARSEMSDRMVMGRQDSGCAAASPKGHASVSGNRTGFEGQEMSSATVSSATAPICPDSGAQALYSGPGWGLGGPKRNLPSFSILPRN